MSARALLARALAAVAVTGLAVAGPALSAGAATEPPPVVSLTPTGVTVDVGTRPVVTVGAPSAPAPGVHATVPASGDTDASVGGPDRPVAPLTPPVTTASTGAVAPLLGPTSSAARLVDADVSLRVCLAAALLGGRADGCASPAPAPSGPSLADAVARTFLCARVAVLGVDDVAACDPGHPSGPGGPVPPALLGTDAASGACLTATVVGTADPSRCGAPAGPATAPGGIDGATAALESTTCAVVTVLGGATGCPGTSPEPAGPSTGSGGNGGTVVSTVDACVALAALASDVSPACPATSATGTPGGDGGAPGTTPVLVTAPTAAPGSTVFGAELAGTTGGSGSAGSQGDLAFSGADTLFLTLAGVGAIAGGAALRRAGRLGAVR